MNYQEIKKCMMHVLKLGKILTALKSLFYDEDRLFLQKGKNNAINQPCQQCRD